MYLTIKKQTTNKGFEMDIIYKRIENKGYYVENFSDDLISLIKKQINDEKRFEIIYRYIGLNQTFQRIADDLGISATRVNQLYYNALRRLSKISKK